MYILPFTDASLDWHDYNYIRVTAPSFLSHPFPSIANPVSFNFQSFECFCNAGYYLVGILVVSNTEVVF